MILRSQVIILTQIISNIWLSQCLDLCQKVLLNIAQAIKIGGLTKPVFKVGLSVVL